jgi:RNA polymerase primary sigma factor
MARIRRHRRDTVQSPLETYLREINEVALLTADEEKMLAKRIEQGDDQARDRMVRANLRLVVNIARGYVGKGLALQDLIEEGNLGLLAAVQGFDPRSGRGSARTRATGSSSRSSGRWSTRPSRSASRRTWSSSLQVAADVGRPAGFLGRPPTVEEIARALEIPKKKLAIVKKAIKVYNLVPRPTSPRTAGASARCSWTSGTGRPDVEMVEADDLKLVLLRLEEMDKREATVLPDAVRPERRAPKTLKEIGESLGLTRERVRQIENEALGKLSATFLAD